LDDAKYSAQKILTRWAGTLPHHPYSDFQQKASITSAAESPAYVIRLMTIYDVRTPQGAAALPFKKDAPPPATDLWSLKVDLKADYIRDETQAVLPLSATPEPCGSCSGSGKRACKDCSGSKVVACPDCVGPDRRKCPECEGLGKQACIHCKGTGMVASSRDQQSPCQSCAGTGGPPCKKCQGKPLDCDRCKNTKEVACANCNTEGRVSCTDCGGGGEILKARNFLIEYQPILEKRVYADPQTPAGLLPPDFPREAVSPLIGDAEDGKVPALLDQLPAPLRAAVDAAIARAEAAKKEFSGEARIIKRRLTIEKIPVYSVAYEFEGKKYACWASSLGDKVAAATTPFTELSQVWAKEAQEQASHRNFDRAEELIKNASELAPGPWLDGLSEKIAKAKTAQSSALTLAAGAGAVLLATAALAATHRVSHHLLWPCAGFLAACAAGLAASQRLLVPVIGRRGASTTSVIATAGLFLVVSAINPFLRLDAAELSGLLQHRFGGAAIPSTLSPDDESYLNGLIATYQPLGVDVQALADALEANKQRLAEEERARQELLAKQAAEKRRQEKIARELREIKREQALAKAEAAAAAAKAKALAAKKKKKTKTKKKKPVTHITDSPQ
jgi:hypothetical protein